MHSEIERFENEVKEDIKRISGDESIQRLAHKWHDTISSNRYAYRFKWMGRPIIQEPQDIMAMQELMWKVKPDLIIETGIAHGGSILFSASMLALIDIELGRPDSMVIGVDIDIREHNRFEVNKHKISSKTRMIEGSSIDERTISTIKHMAADYKNVMVCLDSNHTHEHVLAELKAYAPLISVGSYCIVFDTGIEDLPDGSCLDRPWGKGNNPKTAVWEFLKGHKEFEIDSDIENKIIITAASSGFLRKVR